MKTKELPDNFAAIILSHGRSDRVFTYNTLKKCGYTGKIYILCDDEDSQLEKYQAAYPGEVLVFRKDDYAERFDQMDNFGNKACVVYARNAVYDIAKAIGLRYIVVLDDDYTDFHYRITRDGSYCSKGRVRNLDALFAAYLEFLKASNIHTICFMQSGGDWVGGANNTYLIRGITFKRKMMNLFFFDVERPVEFIGTLNEDLTSSITEGIKGKVILSTFINTLNQMETQSNPGGLTTIYLEVGTYVKSFYSIIAAPSCVKIFMMGEKYKRLHHKVSWNYAVPKIVRPN